MRSRTYTPEAPARLEDRVVLSHTAMSGAPIVVSGFSLSQGLIMVKNAFELFATGEDTARNFERLRAMLAQDSKGVPFHVVDGLGMKTNAILDQMQADIASGAPDPIKTAFHEIKASINAEVQMNVDNGSIVVR